MSEPVFDRWRSTWMYPAGDETVALKAAQGLREHLLPDAGSGVAQLTEPLRARLQVLEQYHGPPVG
jgi:hypothetical protein